MAKTTNTVGMIILVAIAMILGVVLVQVIADQVIPKVDTVEANNITLDISPARLYTTSAAAFINNETVSAMTNDSSKQLSVAGLKNAACTVLYVTNVTDGTLITMNYNYTVYNCNISVINSTEYLGQDINVSYLYTYSDNYGAINDSYTFTSTSITPGIDLSFSDDTACDITTIAFRNQSGDLLTSGGIDYTFTGTRARLNNTLNLNQSSSNTTTATFDYCSSDYVGGWGGTALKLVPGFLTLAILFGGLYAMYYILRNEGIEI